MPLSYQLVALKDLARGLDLRSAESNVADGYCEDLQNALPVSSGQLAKRPGYQGVAGYVPFRVTEASHDGYSLTLKLAGSIDLTGLASSPISVYGKFPSTQSGDFSTTAALRHYASFSTDIRELFTSAGTTVTKSSSDTGIDHEDVFVTVMSSTSETDQDNTYYIPDSVTVENDGEVQVTATSASTDRCYISVVDKSAASGTAYVADYSGAAIAPSGGTVSGTILASTHGLGNFNFIVRCYTVSGTTYTEFIPDSVTYDDSTGDVSFSFSSASNFDGKVLISVPEADNIEQVTVAAGSTDTIVVSDISTNFPYWSLWRLSGSTWHLTLPDSVVVDDSAGTITVSITNATASPETYEFYYDFATIASNTIRVVDSTATSASYAVTEPQMTVWGVNHTGRYLDSATRGGHVLHIDSYKRDAEARLVCGLGGNLYAARTRSEIGSTYQLPQLSVDLDARIASNVSMAPLFQLTGTSSTVRTRGIITGDNVTASGALVTSASFVSVGTADITLSLTNKTGTLALSTQVATTDYLTVTGMAHAVHNGTFKVVSVPSQDSSSVTLRVTNAALLTADYDESGAAGRANVYTDNFTTTASTNYIAGDVIRSDSIDLTLTVKSVSGTTVTVSGVTSTVALAAGSSIFGRRTAYVQPLKDSSSTASVTYLVRGDMVSVSGLTRLPRVTYLHPFQDMAVDITVANGVATVDLGPTSTVSAVTHGSDLFTTSAAHEFSENDPVRFASTESLPTGVRSDTVYYVDLQSSTTFKIMPKEGGTVLNLTDTGSGTITVERVHGLSVGQRVTVAQTGDPLLDGVVAVTATADLNTFTFTTTADDGDYTGVLVGRTAEFDESLTFTDALTGGTTVTVGERWVPVEAPTATGDLPKTTYTSYFDDTETTLRSCVVGGNMYFANYSDEILKFDGTSVYQAGLVRWQPQLFVQVATASGSGAASLADNTGQATQNGAGSAKTFTVADGTASQFAAGDKVVHSGDSALYTVSSVDTTNHKVNVTTTISDTTTTNGTLTVVATYRYYFRLNAIDSNNNIIAGAVTGSQDFIVEMAQTGRVHMRLVGMPAWGVYDYDRLELEVYRTKANAVAPYYLVRRVSLKDNFSETKSYIDVWDGDPDETFVSVLGDDDTMVALKGGELGTAWDQPPRAKYLTTVNNRLVLANIKDYQRLDIVLRKPTGSASVTTTNLSGLIFTFRKTITDESFTTNMVDRITYEFVTSGAVTIDPATDIARDATSFTITENAHGRSVGDWVYFFHSATGVDKDLHFAGWFQISSKTTNTFTLRFANDYTPSARDVDRYVSSSSGVDVPVWLGTDGNFQTKYGNTSGSYEQVAAYRLASAINSSMVAVDVGVTGQEDFVPWLTAGAGNEYDLGQVIVSQPKHLTTTMEVLVGSHSSGINVYVNNVRRSEGDEVSAVSLLYPSRVVISYENYPELFDGPFAAIDAENDSAVDVNSADGEEITGVVPFFGESAFGSSQVESLVVVFKTNSIYLLDVRTRQVQKIDSQGLGCTAPYSIAPTRNGIMFANLSGVYRLNRNLTVSYVGKMVERYWRDTVNLDEVAVATGHNYGVGRQYRLSVPVDDSDENSMVLVYDHTRESQEQEFGAWTRYTNHPATGWANLDDDAYFATSTGQVFKVRRANDSSDYRDDASAITMSVTLKAMDFGLPGARKACRNAVVHMRMDKTNVTGTTVSAAVDLGTTFASCGTVSATTLGTKKVETFRVSLPTPRFTFLQMKLENAVKDENFVLAGVDFLVAALGKAGVKERSELD